MKKKAWVSTGAAVLSAVLAAGILIPGRYTASAAGQANSADAVNLFFEGASVLPGSRVAVVSKNTKGEFWDLVKEGMADAVSDCNEALGFKGSDKVHMTFEGPRDELEVETQINTLEAVIAENPDVLCLCAGDMDSCQAQLEAAAENGIPVIAFDSTVSVNSLVQAYVGTDNRAAGRMAAEKLAKAIGGSGKVAVFSVQEKTSALLDRIEGFREAMEAYPDIEIASELSQDQVEDIRTAMEEVLTETEGLAGVYCSNADITDIYLKLSLPEGVSPVMVGTDADSAQQTAIREGRELGCVSQNPYAIGYRTMAAALCMSQPDAQVEELLPEGELLLPARWIDSAGLDQPLNEEYLY